MSSLPGQSSPSQPSPLDVVSLGNGVDLRCTFHVDTSLKVNLTVKSDTVLEVVLKPSAPQQTDTANSASVQASCAAAMDFFAGELTLTATVSVPDPSHPGSWTSIASVADDVVLRVDPTFGMINGSVEVTPPVAADEGWGPSGSSSPVVTRMHVDSTPRSLTDAGSIVWSELFAADYHPFTFNTVACCGTPDPHTDVGVYSDPRSPWFNVFYGIYQLDCLKSDQWTRPFGYESAAGVASVVHVEDLVRLGKADWNWFSNYLYGVPAAVCTQYSAVDMTKINPHPTTIATIGTSQWHQVVIDGIVVASCYQSDAPGAAKLVENTSAMQIWDRSFGLPCPRPEYTVSFIPTTLTASLDMAYWEDADGFHTLVFGGTCGPKPPAGFLAAQMTAVQGVMAKAFPGAGFPVG